MNEVQSLLSLPLETLAMLAAGYLGYRLAYSGRDEAHATVDVIFLTFVFALIARTAASGLGTPTPRLSGQLVGIGAALLIAILWRRWAEAWVFSALRLARISTSDRRRSAWDVVRTDASLHPTELIVRRKDGVMLKSSPLAAFGGLRPGAPVYGSDGSVALYVTHQIAPGEGEWEPITVTGDGDWGSLLTYVPAAEIQSIYVRH